MQSDLKQGSIMYNDEKLRIMADYMENFEQKVMIPCVDAKVFTRKIMVSTKRPKLLFTKFGRFVGEAFKHEDLLVLNYYGLNKLSTGFLNKVQKLRNEGFDIKTVETIVVYFAAIKMANITTFAPELTNGFTDFKDYLVDMRGFRANKESTTGRL